MTSPSTPNGRRFIMSRRRPSITSRRLITTATTVPISGAAGGGAGSKQNKKLPARRRHVECEAHADQHREIGDNRRRQREVKRKLGILLQHEQSRRAGQYADHARDAMLVHS